MSTEDQTPAVDGAPAQPDVDAAAAQQADPGEPGAPGLRRRKDPEKRQKQQQRRKRIILLSSVVGGLVLLVAAAAITVAVLNSTVHGPAAVVQRYVNAIAAGDAELANSMVPPERVLGAGDAKAANSSDDSAFSKALLTNDVLKSAKHITAPATGSVHDSDGTTVVTVTYTLDGKQYTDEVAVEKTGKQGLFDTWKIDSALTGQINASTGNDFGISVNGVHVDGKQAALPMIGYPGIYEVAPPTSKYLTGDTKTVPLTSFHADANGSASVDLKVTATDALTAEVQQQFTAYLTDCLASTALDTTCKLMPSYQQDDYTDVGPVTWTLTAPPTVAVNPDGTSFSVSGGHIDVSFTGSWNAGPHKPQKLVFSELDITGKITIDEHDTVTIEMPTP